MITIIANLPVSTKPWGRGRINGRTKRFVCAIRRWIRFFALLLAFIVGYLHGLYIKIAVAVCACNSVARLVDSLVGSSSVARGGLLLVVDGTGYQLSIIANECFWLRARAGGGGADEEPGAACARGETTSPTGGMRCGARQADGEPETSRNERGTIF